MAAAETANGPHLGLPGAMSGWIRWCEARQHSWLAEGGNDVVVKGISDGDALGGNGGRRGARLLRALARRDGHSKASR